MEGYWIVTWPIVMGLLAAGAVLFIKIARRRQATRSGQFGGTVPANPMSPEHARRLSRRYAITSGLIVALLVLIYLFAASAR